MSTYIFILYIKFILLCMYYFYEDYCKITKQKEKTVYEDGKEVNGFETVTILNLNLLLPIARTTLAEIRGFMTMVGGEGIDF